MEFMQLAYQNAWLLLQPVWCSAKGILQQRTTLSIPRVHEALAKLSDYEHNCG